MLIILPLIYFYFLTIFALKKYHYSHMKFNQEKFLQDAFRLFMSMNYEKASFTKLAQVTGMTGAGMSYYYPNKEAIFKAVVDKFVLQTHSPENKFKVTATTLKDFIVQYVEGIEQTMKKLRVFCDDNLTLQECSRNNYHFLIQASRYYPGFDTKINEMFKKEYDLWRQIIANAKETGEIYWGVDVEKTASIFRQIYWGLAFEMSFTVGLDTQKLLENLQYTYSLLVR